MRLVIIVGSESGKEINLPVDRLHQAFPDIDVMKNSLPDDGVALFDCASLNRLDKAWARAPPYILGMCEHATGFKTNQGPLSGDFLQAAIDYIAEGELDQPPEENAGLTLG